MRVLFVDAPPELLEERRRRGLDVRDELWEGVVHVVPQPVPNHQIFGSNVIRGVGDRVAALGFVLTYEVAVYRPGEQEWSYRVPDLLVTRPAYITDKGVAGPPELVIEILSPHDESREKFPFYAAVGCREVLLIDRVMAEFELYRLAGGELIRVAPDAGVVRVEAFDAELSVAGGTLRLVRDGGEAEIPFGE